MLTSRRCLPTFFAVTALVACDSQSGDQEAAERVRREAEQNAARIMSIADKQARPPEQTEAEEVLAIKRHMAEKMSGASSEAADRSVEAETTFASARDEVRTETAKMLSDLEQEAL